MKKRICFVIIVLLILNGCYAKEISLEQSKVNLMKYYTDIKNVVQSYGYIIERESKINKEIFAIDYNIYGDLSCGEVFIVKINDNSYMEIRMNNSNNTEKFHIEFNSELSSIDDTHKNINIPLFVEIVNAISGKEITEELVEEFLNDPENKYLDDWYETYLMVKSKDLYFLSDWIMSYYLDESVSSEDLTEEFIMSGLTKQLEE